MTIINVDKRMNQTMNVNNKLPLHTRLGTYATVVIIILLCTYLLRNFVSAVYYGSITDEKETAHFYELGFQVGSKQIENSEYLSEESSTNPFLVKEYRKGFRDGSDSTRNKIKRDKNEKN